MDRCTIRLQTGEARCSWLDGDSVVELLARYEDTGLTPDEIAALRAERDTFKAAIEAGRLVRVPQHDDYVYKAQPNIGIVSGVVTGVEVMPHEKVFVKFRECRYAPLNYGGWWMVDTWPTEEAARAALEGGQHD